MIWYTYMFISDLLCNCSICYGLLLLLLLFLFYLLFYFIRRKCYSSDILALKEKNAFGFCTVIVLFTLGAYLVQLCNEVFDFTWSTSTRGINLCVV